MLLCDKIWKDGDVTLCFRQWYFQTVLLATATLGSLLIAYLKSTPRYSTARKPNGSLSIFSGHSSYGAVESPETSARPDEDQTYGNGLNVSSIVVEQSTTDRLKSAGEALGVLAQLILVIYAFFFSTDVSNEGMDLMTMAGLWSYCTILVIIRRRRRHLPNGLWKHSEFLYAIASISSLVSVRSAYLGETDQFTKPAKYFYIAQLSLSCLLFCALGSSKTVDGPAIVEIVKGEIPSPEPVSSLFEIATLGFMGPLLSHGYRNILELKDVYSLSSEDSSRRVAQKVQAIEARARAHSGKSNSLSILKLILKYSKWQIFVCTVLTCTYAILLYVPVVLVKVLLEFAESEPSVRNSGLAWTAAISIFLIGVGSKVVDCRAIYLGNRMDVQVNGLLANEIYAKLLKRKSSSDSATTGQIINLMSVDSRHICQAIEDSHLVTGLMFEFITAIVLLYYILGWSAFAGLAVCGIMIPVNYFFSMKLVSIENAVMEVSDERIEATNELFHCIKIIKYFAWESRFMDKVNEVREREVKVLREQIIYMTLYITIWIGTPVVIIVATFSCYVKLQGEVLTSSVAFTALTMFNMLQGPLSDMGDVSASFMEAKVSLDRINKFLNEPETTKYEQLTNSRAKTDKIGFFNNASFEWSSDSFKLRDLNVEFPKNQLSLITGTTGSGKTSMLMALLGEMDRIKGQVYLPNGGVDRSEIANAGAVAYCAQQPWLLNDTLKNNILFSSDYNHDRYQRVVEACALLRDFEVLDKGDDVLVGEKGVVLSGGQKQRISLARAVYSNSKVLLLDDCLSAVDSGTASHIYNHCLTGNLVRGRTVILVSHNISLAASKADKVVVLSDGKVIKQGAVSEVDVDTLDIADDTPNPGNQKNDSKTNDHVKNDTEGDENTDLEVTNANDPQEEYEHEEYRASGRTSSKVYYTYLSVIGNKWFWVAVLLAYTVENFFKMNMSLWLRQWALDTYNQPVTFYIGWYIVITIVAISSALGEAGWVMLSTLNAAQKMYHKLLNAVVSANLRFFDTTPLGQIMNRFSRDVEDLDTELPSHLEFMLHMIFTVLSATCMICFATPQFLPVAIITFVLYGLVGEYYLMTSRELQRLYSNAKSPFYQHFGQTITGVSTIRAYGECSRFIAKNQANLDQYRRPDFYLKASTLWLIFKSEVLGSLIAFFSAIFVILNVDRIDAGLAGLALSFSLSYPGNMFDVIRTYSRVELNMNNVERVIEYTEIPSENYDGDEPPMNWPSLGEIEFNNFGLKYASDLPLVLKELNFKVHSCEKVAICGRTGAGKSSLLAALFRLVEADSGSISIDGVDIRTLHLTRLRESLATIQQDPTLFNGTIRSNLDPFGLYTDLQLMEALKRVHLISDDSAASSVSSGENANQFTDLENPVTEGGHNLSQGQRQLMCLARALLKKCKILLLDEATASIDYQTDAKIQKTIREEFSDCTLLTIAHRLESVMDYDRIMVLDHGSIAEFDTPHNLKQKEGGIFKSMVDASA